MTTATLNASPYRNRDGSVRYEEKDLYYIDRKVQEAAKMDDPDAQREHLQDVLELYANKYGVTRTVESLIANADYDLVYIQKMLQEVADDPDPQLISMEEFKQWLRERFGDDIFD